MQVGKDTVVTIDYTARLDDGHVVDSTAKCGPVTYLHGNEQIFPQLEEAVDGLEPGAERRVRLDPERAYGPWRKELVRRIPRANLPADLAIEVGERYSLRTREGKTLAFKVAAVEGNQVVADFNSRAAGQGLTIEARVVSVRNATAAEIRRGTLR
jgi:FKBP-type peptidyl-prolyl cis-trans isomerase SlyD